MATVTTPRAARRDDAAGERGRPLPLWFTALIAAVLMAATCYGLLVDAAYRVSPGVRETLPQTLRGQDLVTLLAVPVLVGAAVKARAGSLRAHIVWLALLLYVAYSYLMYVVAPFNDVFLLYVAAIGLASYGLLDGLMRLDMRVAGTAFGRVPRRALGGFLITVGLLFGGLWLAQVLPAIPGGVPDGLFVYDIPNTVHVLDLAFVLPLVVASGILVLRRHAAAPVLAGLVLVKMVTLGLALLSMNAFVYADTGSANAGESVVWAAVAAIAGSWLVTVFGRAQRQQRGWLRPRLWP